MSKRFWWWVLASTALLLFWPAVTLLEPLAPFRIQRDQAFAQVCLVAGHLLGGVVLWWIWSSRERLQLQDVLLSVFACGGLGLLTLLVVRSDYSRFTLFITFAMSVATYVVFYAAVRRRSTRMERMGAAFLSLAAVLAVAIAFFHYSRPSLAAESDADAPETTIINSTYYPIEIVEYSGLFPRPQMWGGAIKRFGDSILLVTGDGRFYRITLPDSTSSMMVDELPLEAPINVEAFKADLPEDQSPDGFRVADVMIHRGPEGTRLFVSHLYWKTDQQCYVVRVSRTEAYNELSPELLGDSWETIFETTPCISFNEIPIFRGYELGGRMVQISDSEFLLTVGDFGSGYTTRYAQMPEVSYGKVLRIRFDDGSSKPYSIGHRNPQGLYLTNEGKLWSTEHGPKGGDELNALQDGNNYGWPHATYGTAYDRYDWPVTSSGEAFSYPVFSWVPSVGTSSLIEIQSSLFSMWHGDLLVASMKARSLFRVHLEGDRAIFAEPIGVGGRVRDLIEDRYGRVILWMDAGSLLVLQPVVEENNNAAAFMTQCGGCHPVAGDGIHGIGPDLGGIMGEPIAAADNYDYSPALTKARGRWTEDALRRFLANPQKFAPGTKMVFSGLMTDDEMDKIVAHLKSLNGEMAAADVER